MQKDKLTILLSTFNGESYIIEQLNSIKNQYRKPDKVIIKDDASTDDTVIIIDKYIKDNGLKHWDLIVNGSNVGWEANFASLVSLVDTEYFMFCDQDDIWFLNKTQIMLDIMNNNPQIELLASNFHVFYDDADTSDKMPKHVNDDRLYPVAERNCLQIRYPGCVLCARYTLKDLFSDYWQEGIPHDSFLISAAMIRNSFYVYNHELIMYRRHKGTATHTKIRNKQERIDQLLYYYKRLDICDVLYANYGMESFSGNKLKQIRKWVDNRYDLVNNRNRLCFIKNIPYLLYYWSPKTMMADLYYSFK